MRQREERDLPGHAAVTIGMPRTRRTASTAPGACDFIGILQSTDEDSAAAPRRAADVSRGILGEAAGYLRGPKDTFQFVDLEEFMILERLGSGRPKDPRIAGFVSLASPMR